MGRYQKADYSENIALFLAEGKTYAEIAALLGVPKDNVRYQVKKYGLRVHPPSLQCDGCGQTFTPAYHRPKRKFCSLGCKNNLAAKQLYARNKIALLTLKESEAELAKAHSLLNQALNENTVRGYLRPALVLKITEFLFAASPHMTEAAIKQRGDA